ncbi:unnamed protein product [Allacma fusca]|uniref:DNA-directed RNA polymerase III subunit RPC9 n=1 Tax=Allacma fusca TaxID=39272 RepID=A0A8J2Q5J9_9HEXA|nr:unnamed protein product [Allacma fusca]
MAGFSAVEIITEATAAAIAYLHAATPPHKLLVFDLGMSTFDLTILKVEGKKIHILAVGGDSSIGGDNFTNEILNYVMQDHRKRWGGEEYDPTNIGRLRIACKLKKKELFSSTCKSVQIGKPGYLFRNVAEIGEVILVGGSTRVPTIEKIIKEKLPRATVRKSIEVDTVVVRGAAIQTSTQHAFKEIYILPFFEPNLDRLNVHGICTPATIGVQFTYNWQINENNSNYGILIPKGTEIPCFAEKTFWFLQERGVAVIRVVEGENNDAVKNDELGQLQINGIKASNGYCELKIQMYLSADAELTVRSVEAGIFNAFKEWEFMTIDVMQARKLNHFYVHRPDNPTSNYFSHDPKSGQKNYKIQIDLARLYYQQNMDSVVSSLEFIADEEFKKTHEKSVDDALEELNKAHPLTLELLQFTKDHLGTLFENCLAFMGEDGMEFIRDQNDKTFIPTCITFEEGETTFGSTAQEKAISNPAITVIDIKRMIGRHIEDPQVAQLRKFWPFETLAENGNIYVRILDTKYRPEQLIELYVEYLIELAVGYLGHDVINAVVAIPLYFTPRQRHLTKEAFHNAGINVLRLLNEPTAASLAYSDMISEVQPKTCLIFDLGGGTLDIAILEVTGSTGVKVKEMDGDPFLGGVDFDNELMKYCIKEFEKQENIQFPDAGYSHKKRRLRKECEKAKEILSSAEQVTVTLESFHDGWNLVVPVTRKTFENLIEEKLEKCMAIVDKLVDSVEINEVVLVGGSSRIPRVKKKFGEKVTISRRLHPSDAVARGAALKAMEFNPNQTAGNPSTANRKPFKMKMVGYLSNYEVFKYFSEIKEASSRNEDRASALKYNKHLSTIVYEAVQYFKKSPCTVQSPVGIAEFMRRIKPFGLTKLEQLSILNTRPSMPVDIQALIEESEERLTEDQVDEIIQIVDQCLPPVDTPDANPDHIE